MTVTACGRSRCLEPALSLNYPLCYRHALEVADRRVTDAEAFREWVQSQHSGATNLLGERV